MTRLLAPLTAALLLAACATQQAYEGPARSRSDIAVIEGGPAVNAGLPIVPIIRKIDDRVVHFGYSQVAVEPGTHRVLVDCVMQSAHTTTRHELSIEAYPGRRYVLSGESEPGNRRCGAVRVEER